jgi:hypothetical protein
LSLRLSTCVTDVFWRRLILLCLLLTAVFTALLLQGGVSTVAWVLGHQIFDLLGLLLQPALMFAWLYVLTLPSVSAGTYYSTLALVGWYTSGLGYLVSRALVLLLVGIFMCIHHSQVVSWLSCCCW